MPRKKLAPLPRPRYSSRAPQYIPKPQEKPKYRGMAMSVEDMAEELAIGRNIAYELVQQPGFPSFQIGRRVLVSRKGLQDWIDVQCKKSSDASLIPERSEP